MKYVIVLLLIWSPTLFAEGKVVLFVEGMTCPMCAGKIESKLKEHKEISNVDIDINAEKIEVSIKEGLSLERKDIETKIVEAGFKIKENTK